MKFALGPTLSYLDLTFLSYPILPLIASPYRALSHFTCPNSQHTTLLFLFFKFWIYRAGQLLTTFRRWLLIRRRVWFRVRISNLCSSNGEGLWFPCCFGQNEAHRYFKYLLKYILVLKLKMI